MATVKKIRDGMFLINWINEKVEPRSEILLDCPEIFGNSFHLCSLFCGVENNKCSLYVDFHCNLNGAPFCYEQYDRAKTINMWASRDGVQRKVNIDAECNSGIPIWVAKWEIIPTTCPCNNLPPKPLRTEFEILIDLHPSYDHLLRQQNRKRRESYQHLVNLLKNQNPTDVIFKLQDQQVVKSHSAILACISPVLAAKFQDDLKEKQEMVIEVTDIKAEVFQQFIEYAYTKVADFKKVDVAADLMVAADKFGVLELKEDCENYLIKKLHEENVDSFLVLAHRHSLPKLTESSIELIAKNPKPYIFGKNWTELMKNYPEIAIQVTRRLL